MFFKPPNLAPEPFCSGALYVLYQVALYMRKRSTAISAQQLFDLGDAIHNIPDCVTAYGPHRDEETVRGYLAAYDEKWSRSPGDFSLLQTLESGIASAKAWRARNGVE